MPFLLQLSDICHLFFIRFLYLIISLELVGTSIFPASFIQIACNPNSCLTTILLLLLCKNLDWKKVYEWSDMPDCLPPDLFILSHMPSWSKNKFVREKSVVVLGGYFVATRSHSNGMEVSGWSGSRQLEFSWWLDIRASFGGGIFWELTCTIRWARKSQVWCTVPGVHLCFWIASMLKLWAQLPLSVSILSIGNF